MGTGIEMQTATTTTTVTTTSTTTRSTFFTQIPDDVLYRLWHECDFRTRFYQLKGRSKGIFHRVLPHLIDRLFINSDLDGVHLEGTYSVNYIRGVKSCEMILSEYGHLFNSLELRFVSNVGKAQLLRTIAQYCTSLTSLFVRLDVWDGHVRDLVRRFGTELEEIEVESFDRTHTHDAALHIAVACPNLRSFTFSGSGIRFIEPIWRFAGPRLEYLAVRARFASPEEWSATLSSVRSYCTELSRIVLSGLGLNGIQVAQLLASYGKQLREFMVSKLDVNHTYEIVNKCTNLERCVLIELDDRFRRMAVLNHVLSELFIYIASEFDYNALLNASEKCKNITKLVVECHEPVRYIPALFVGSKNSIHTLELDVDVFRKEDMITIAKNTGNLTSVSIDGASINQGDEETLFEKLALCNPNLQYVSFTMAIDGFTFQDAMQDDTHKLFASGIAKAFRCCKQLKSIEVSNRRLSAPFPERLCEHLRSCFEWYYRRRVRVYIYGARYLRA